MMSEGSTVVLAYSGGLDTSCILVWLKEKGYQVITYTANVGQDENFEETRKKAENLGAKKVIIEDLREKFIKKYIFPAVGMGLVYENRYLLGTSLARPCIAKGLMKAAEQEGATHVCHGATGKGNDQVRFELACHALCPWLKIITPWRDPEFYNRFQGRTGLFEYAKQNNIPMSLTPKSPWSMDDNCMHISYESGVLDDAWLAPPEGIFRMTKDPSDCPDKPQRCIIHFDKGIPASINLDGVEIHDDVEIFKCLNIIGGEHGIGRIDIVENRFIGTKCRCLYECPAGTILYTAHLDLETFCLDKEVRKLKQYLAERMSEVAYNGFWFSPEGEYLRKCLEESQKPVRGEVKLSLYKGHVSIEGRRSRNGLYNPELVSLDSLGDYNPTNATGFINLNALRLTEHYRVNN